MREMLVGEGDMSPDLLDAMDEFDAALSALGDGKVPLEDAGHAP